MYRRLFLSVYRTRSRAIHAKETCVLKSRCDIATLPVFRAVNAGGGLRALSTTSTAYKELSGGGDDKELPRGEDIKNEAKDRGELQEAANVSEEKGTESEAHVRMTGEQVEQRVEVNPAGGEVPAVNDVKAEGLKEAPEHQETIETKEAERGLNVQTTVTLDEGHHGIQQVTTEGEQKDEKTPKRGKAGLLDLLGSMKVDLTTKKRRRTDHLVMHRPSSESVSRPAPAPMESTISMFQNATVDDPVQSETLSPELVAAASAAASALPNRAEAKSDLLRQLRQHEADADAQRKGGVNNIKDIIADMKVGKRPDGGFDEDGQRRVSHRGITADLARLRSRRSLFSGKRLNIFAPSIGQDLAAVNVAPPTLWDIELANQMALCTTPPRNGFDEMIRWTREGKLWQYPINNEAGLEEEALVPFHEHVFLEKHLEGFPRQGPIRHFMELVVAGLSKNPNLSVLKKTEHIAWFREYFQQKEDVLKDAEVYLN